MARGTIALGAALAAHLASPAGAARVSYSLRDGWKFELQGGSPQPCADPNTTFPLILDGQQCTGLTQVLYAQDETACLDACCSDDTCGVWQFCPSASGCSGGGAANSCWTGPLGSCQTGDGWVSRGRHVTPTPTPSPGANCADPRCAPGTDDSSWRTLSIPHDFVVEGNFTNSAGLMSHGYLPNDGVGWYRRHFSLPPAAPPPTDALWLELAGVMSSSTVWLNGVLLGGSQSGYTTQRFWLPVAALNWGGADNVLAVRSDASPPDSWWYDGGGIYRDVTLTWVSTPGAFLLPWGLYAPTNVTGPISWMPSGQPVADVQLWPSVDVANNASTALDYALTLTVYDASGATVASTTGSGTVPAGSVATWSPAAPVAIANMSLWHLVEPPLKPSLYRVVAALSVGGNAGVDVYDATIGARSARFDAANGFFLNGVPTKILGTANHQDFAAVGAAVPDRLQWHRVAKLKEMGVNGWRTAHNAPNPALLDACDELGMVVWDENHHNGQLDQIPLLVLRDRNHPSVVIWSVCNEVLCKVDAGSDWIQEALAAKALMHGLDPRGGRVVSANQNSWLGPNTPLDLQGVDYSTASYDKVHADAPTIPCISSETSSAVSDRGEYVNNGTAGHVSGYDSNFPGWGQTAEGAWGGVGEPDGQGILTRSFVSGGWTWTGWDYRGEPTPMSWPDVSSHFGILDIAGFPKDRFYWYKAWFPNRTATGAPPSMYIFPSTWNDWPAGAPVSVWAFSDADEVELLLNGASLGRQPMPRYAHVNWTVPYAPGTLTGLAYVAGTSAPVANWTVVTAGAPAALRLSVKDGVGLDARAGCNDAALFAVELVDAAGVRVPGADVAVTFAVEAGSPPGAAVAGTANGDPASLVPNLSPSRPTFHGLVMAVVRVGDAPGTLTVSASAPGLPTAQLSVPVTAPDFSDPSTAKWCPPATL